ncbi:MAG: HyaD/HybD family hydrogenase maturation endopeptidase [Rhodanobacter sp.]|jgi:hydrogenase maturation protease|nr:HyaD/HybD family hydrogenase maturation endopeptidase [Rhodanobacter sp.]
MSAAPVVNAMPGTIVVLGIGNLLWADEGFGVRCLQRLAAGYEFPPSVQLIDGGTQGLYLLPLVQEAERLLILDAIDYGLPPGSLRRIDGDAVPAYLSAKKMSLHQTGFQEVLALARFTGSAPRETTLIGCQPESLDDYGGSLRESVRAALEPAQRMALDVLAGWGVEPHARTRPDTDTSGLSLARYEAERPSAEAACRIGDSRVFAGAMR